MEPMAMIAHHTDVPTARAAREPSVLGFAPFPGAKVQQTFTAS